MGGGGGEYGGGGDGAAARAVWAAGRGAALAAGGLRTPHPRQACGFRTVSSSPPKAYT